MLNRKVRGIKQRGNVSASPPGSGDDTGVTLSRDLKLFDITMIGIGAMIGAGVFVLTGIAAGKAGPGLTLAFVLNGLMASLTAMAYAELGAVYPGAGGGYLWVRQALGGTLGFLSGWMGWFASAVAGSLYALAFGQFATELLRLFNLPIPELAVLNHPPEGFIPLVFMTLVVIVFTFINYRGASEAGSVGNIITLTKIMILGATVLFGLVAMLRTEGWSQRFTVDFLPFGASGVFVAMGLTFIAFEGYEIIAQSGEEVVDPYRTLPRAIFTSIIVAVVIYVLVAFTVIGAVQVPPDVDMLPFEYLGAKGEVAIVEAANQFFPFGTGALILLIAGLASTMSALNATTYSASRVAFAMGRDNNLPAPFALIHPRRHTPHWAIIFSASIIVGVAWLLPLDTVAAAASVMYLLLFMQVNAAALVLRRKIPHVEGAFRIPLFPWIPVLGLVTQMALAIYVFTFNPTAWYTALGWLAIGWVAYTTYFTKIEKMEKPPDILLEEVLVSRDYSVLVPVATQEQARILGQIGSIVAKDHNGEVLALHVLRVPRQLTLADGRYLLEERRSLPETVSEQALAIDVPVHKMIRLGRDISEVLARTAIENASDLMVLGWPGYTHSAGQEYGSVIDPVIDNPPCDTVVVRYRKARPLRSVLVPVSGGPNSRRAVQMAISMARQAEGGPARVDVISIVPEQCPPYVRVRAQQGIDYSIDGSTTAAPFVHTSIIPAQRVVDGILQAAQSHDLIVMGATKEPLLRNVLTGSIPTQIARRAEVTVMIVKRRSTVLISVLRQTILQPSTGPNVRGNASTSAAALTNLGADR